MCEYVLGIKNDSKHIECLLISKDATAIPLQWNSFDPIERLFCIEGKKAKAYILRKIIGVSTVYCIEKYKPTSNFLDIKILISFSTSDKDFEKKFKEYQIIEANLRSKYTQIP